MKRTTNQSEIDKFTSDSAELAQVFAKFLEQKNTTRTVAIYGLFICAIALANQDEGISKKMIMELSDSLWESMKKIK